MPISAFAQDVPTHIMFSNNAPQYISTINSGNSYEEPFGLGCTYAVSGKGKVTWMGSSEYASEQYAYNQALPVYGTVILNKSSVQTFWSGTDISTTTLPSDKIITTYNSDGNKTMWFGATNGSVTEMVNCGNTQVSLSDPVPQYLVLPNGVKLQY